ncbi:uncharacterized protein LOC130312652 [Hyla sarda]|uniref:uncharacterized protein LOC130312652 n=1 Tax=Hyla sarda TaxID=327740 RepID=UPI0024C2BCBA|nr:uncharacterized protein LOC130312652 [Hyla sarda]
MATSPFYTFYVCALFVCISILSFYIHQSNKAETPRQEPITALGNRTFIISPFYDLRNDKEVRVLSIVHVSVKELYCLFHCLPNQMVLVRGQIDIHEDRFDFPYGTADILCKEPSNCEYDDISIQESNSTSGEDIVLFRVRNHPPEPYTVKFTVCISAVFGQYNNVLQAIQSIEMYRLLGASRVTIYNNSCSQAMDKVLRYYSQQGFVEVVQWPIDRHLLTSTEWHYAEGLTSQIGYYGQTAALNDCLYRNMYRSKYVLLNDLDEIILPAKHWNWTSLMVELEKKFPGTSVFCVDSHTFPVSANVSGFDLWTKVPGVNILSHPFREPINRNDFNNPKIIVNPRQVLQTSIHFALKFKGQSRYLDQSMAITFHCRKGKRNDVSQKDLIEDQILRRYNLSLVPNVQKVIDHVFSKN